jgi:endonuclease/exonuclease/phosphatase family metal-dependent hydrolase
MEKTSSENDQVVMMGDFNVDQHKDDRMKKIMNNYKFKQLIKESTCVTKDTSRLIDHTCMYVTNDYNYNAAGVIPRSISDHHHTYIIRKKTRTNILTSNIETSNI